MHKTLRIAILVAAAAAPVHGAPVVYPIDIASGQINVDTKFDFEVVWRWDGVISGEEHITLDTKDAQGIERGVNWKASVDLSRDLNLPNTHNWLKLSFDHLKVKGIDHEDDVEPAIHDHIQAFKFPFNPVGDVLRIENHSETHPGGENHRDQWTLIVTNYGPGFAFPFDVALFIHHTPGPGAPALAALAGMIGCRRKRG